MRESNLAFPAQNRASVCITSQLYDRRALDTTSPLPLFNSLTHLTFLTSTSPRIREIMTMDGGLERLVRILHDFSISPPPPENAGAFYGLGAPTRPALLSAASSSSAAAKRTKPANSGPVPTLNPALFDKHAAYRFSLAFQCVVNIGVRGSESIRSRVVQAGTLDVVGCILEAWLSSKGFAVGPNAAGNGYGTNGGGGTRERETKEQRAARRLEGKEARQREEAAELARALQRSIQLQQEQERRETDFMNISPATRPRSTLVLPPFAGPSRSRSSDLEITRPVESDVDTSADASLTVTPIGTNTPTGAVMVPTRDRSGTIIARTVWDDQPARHNNHHRYHNNHGQPSGVSQPPTPQSPSPDTSRPETETEDDGDVDMDRDQYSFASRHAPRHPHGRAIGIVSDTAPAPISTDDAHINIIVGGGDRNLLMENINMNGGQGVEDGIVLMEANDDFALGAPPGAPGAIMGQLDVDEGGESEGESIMSAQMDDPAPINTHARTAPDETPRPGIVSLPPLSYAHQQASEQQAHTHSRNATLRGRTVPGIETLAATAATNAENANGPNTTVPPSRTNTVRANTRMSNISASASHFQSEGPYRDEDVLLALQLLAYLSKYPHVRQAFYEPRVGFHPVNQTVNPTTTTSTAANGAANSSKATPSTAASAKEKESSNSTNSFFRALASATSRGKQKSSAGTSTQSSPSSTPSGGCNPASSSAKGPPRTNVFALVERFTFRPSSGDKERERLRVANLVAAAAAAANGTSDGTAPAVDIPRMPARLPAEIQYWAGVIMRNACRKDDNRGGIRQCANMLCGRWETYPREFAKCRRCRKAKYCGKECQSTAWAEGHRFWCSAKDNDATDPIPSGTAGDASGHSRRHHHGHAPPAHVELPEVADQTAPWPAVQTNVRNAVPLAIPPAPLTVPPARPARTRNPAPQEVPPNSQSFLTAAPRTVDGVSPTTRVGHGRTEALAIPANPNGARHRQMYDDGLASQAVPRRRAETITASRPGAAAAAVGTTTTTHVRYQPRHPGTSPAMNRQTGSRRRANGNPDGGPDQDMVLR